MSALLSGKHGFVAAAAVLVMMVANTIIAAAMSKDVRDDRKWGNIWLLVVMMDFLIVDVFSCFNHFHGKDLILIREMTENKIKWNVRKKEDGSKRHYKAWHHQQSDQQDTNIIFNKIKHLWMQTPVLEEILYFVWVTLKHFFIVVFPMFCARLSHVPPPPP